MYLCNLTKIKILPYWTQGPHRAPCLKFEQHRVTSAHPSAVIDEIPAANFRIQIANRIIVRLRKPVFFRFFVAELILEEQFMVLATMYSMLIGISFSKEHVYCTRFEKQPSPLPTYVTANPKQTQETKCGSLDRKDTQEIVVGLFLQVVVPTIATTVLELSKSINEATQIFSELYDTIVTPALSQLQDGRPTNQVTNPNTNTFTVSQRTILANFNFFSLGQSSHVHSMSLKQFSLVSIYPDETSNKI